MESLFLRGGFRIHEDALTAALADLIEDLGDGRLIRRWLAACRRVGPRGEITGIGIEGIPAWDRFRTELWPNWKEFGVPDLLLVILRGDLPVAAIGVEVKYEAAKSGEYDAVAPELRDQLGRYAAGLYQEFSDVADRRVVYLTGSSIPPAHELERSWEAIERKSPLEPAQTLAWLSWRDIDRVLADEMMNLPVGSMVRRRVSRMRALLSKAGLEMFSGWELNQALQEEWMRRGRPEEGYVVPGFDASNFVKRLGRICRRARIGRWRTKDLRSTYASQLLSRGIPLKWISRQLGHASTAMTERRYARWIDDEYREPQRLQAGELPPDLLAKPWKTDTSTNFHKPATATQSQVDGVEP